MPRRPYVELFLISFLILFLELAAIRFFGAGNGNGNDVAAALHSGVLVAIAYYLLLLALRPRGQPG